MSFHNIYQIEEEVFSSTLWESFRRRSEETMPKQYRITSQPLVDTIIVKTSDVPPQRLVSFSRSHRKTFSLVAASEMMKDPHGSDDGNLSETPAGCDFIPRDSRGTQKCKLKDTSSQCSNNIHSSKCSNQCTHSSSSKCSNHNNSSRPSSNQCQDVREDTRCNGSTLIHTTVIQ